MGFKRVNKAIDVTDRSPFTCHKSPLGIPALRQQLPVSDNARPHTLQPIDPVSHPSCFVVQWRTPRQALTLTTLSKPTCLLHQSSPQTHLLLVHGYLGSSHPREMSTFAK